MPSMLEQMLTPQPERQARRFHQCMPLLTRPTANEAAGAEPGKTLVSRPMSA